MTRVVLAAACAALAVSATNFACVPFACTAIYVQEGLTVDFTPEPLPEGRYDIEVVADGEPIALSVIVVAEGTTCVTPDGTCRIDRVLPDGRELQLEYTWNGVAVWYDVEGGGPREAAITVRRDGAIAGEATFTPTYQRSEPNGRGCGVSRTAQAELALNP